MPKFPHLPLPESGIFDGISLPTTTRTLVLKISDIFQISVPNLSVPTDFKSTTDCSSNSPA